MAKTKLVYFLPLVSFVALAAFMNATSPLESGPLGVLVVFFISYIFIATTLYLIVSKILDLSSSQSNATSKLRPKLHSYIGVLSLGIILLFALSSLGQLGVQDFILVGLLTGLALFYFARTA